MRQYILFILTIVLLSSCAQTHLDKGNAAFEKMAYKKAAKHYEKYLAKKPDPKIEAKTAQAYEKINDYKNAASHYASALKDNNPELDPSLKFSYAKTLLTTGDKTEALKWAKDYLRAVPNDKGAKTWIAQQEAPLAEPDAKAPKVELSLVKLDGFSAAFSAVGLGSKVYFAGEKTNEGKRNPMTGNSFLSVYVTASEGDGKWKTPKILAGTDSKYHDGPLCFHPNGEKIYLTRSALKDGKKIEKDVNAVNQLKIYTFDIGYPTWVLNEAPLAFNNENASTMHPCMSPDGNKLFFASDRPGGQGGFDLYYVEKQGSGWSTPVSLGFNVNGSKNETFPFLASKDTLYFASDRSGGMGGLDIYQSIYVNGKWAAPTAMPAPYNTVFDDFSFFKYANKEEGFISSNRDGMDQIYTWQTIIPEPVIDTPPAPVVDTVVEVPPVLKLEFKVIGKVVDSKTKKGLADVDVQLLDREEKVLETKKSNADGSFSFDLEIEQVYQLHGVRKNSFTRNKMITTAYLTESKIFEVELELETVALETTITLENIYYDYNKADIRTDATEELKNLVRFMKDNPKANIQVNSHTDSQGKDAENLILSDKRAQSVKAFLVELGIPAERIVAKGFGETKLTNGCDDGVKCTEEQHQANRRTEFTILKLD